MRTRTRLWTLLLLTCCLGTATGCVERRFVITSDPPGAIVYDWKDRPLAAAPADTQFTYYGKYNFTLVKDGYETLHVEENVKAPWHSWFGIDFITENLIPFRFRDVRTFHFQLKPLQMMPPELLLQSANELRGRGQAIGPPAVPAQPPPQPPPVVVPTPPIPGGIPALQK
jgi:hypothetical protein